MMLSCVRTALPPWHQEWLVRRLRYHPSTRIGSIRLKMTSIAIPKAFNDIPCTPFGTLLPVASTPHLSYTRRYGYPTAR
jgi:hypothetical protein